MPPIPTVTVTLDIELTSIIFIAVPPAAPPAPISSALFPPTAEQPPPPPVTITFTFVIPDGFVQVAVPGVV